MSIEDEFVFGSGAVTRRVLPGGLRVLCESVPTARSCSLGIWIGTGSRDDTPGREGISHFIEHMLFKGTERRSARQISEEIDAVGGQLNAFTAKEHTCLYARVLDEDFTLASDILSDMIVNSRICESDVELERTVIMDEISTYEDAPDELVLDLLESAIWEDHPMGSPILGTQESVQLITQADLRAYIDSKYSTARIVIAVAGNISIDRVVAEFATPFLRLGAGRSDDGGIHAQARTNTRIKSKQVEQVHFCMGAPGLSASDPRQYSMYVLNSILGGGPSSRLFQKIREERGLAYEVYSFHSSFRDTGVFGVYAASSPGAAAEVKAILEEEVLDLRSKPPQETEVDRARKQLKGSLLLGLEGTSGRMMRLGRSELMLGRVVPLSEVLENVSRVTKESVLDLAKEVLKPESICFAGVGADASEMEKLLRRE